MDDRKLLALARKNAAKSQSTSPALKRFGKTFDSTLPPTAPVDENAIEDAERMKRFFSEMKAREF